jgi:hypothetical protein
MKIQTITIAYTIGLIPYFQEHFRGALKTRVKIHRSLPVCWHFCWYLGEQTFAATFAIPNKGIEQMARKNDGPSVAYAARSLPPSELEWGIARANGSSPRV